MSTEQDGKGLYTVLPFDRQRYGKDDQIMAVLYTDIINGEQTCRDDLWLATSTGLRDVYAEGRKDEAEQSFPRLGGTSPEEDGAPGLGCVPAAGNPTLGELIAKVGGRINDAGYVEFGSEMAVAALVGYAVAASVRVAHVASYANGRKDEREQWKPVALRAVELIDRNSEALWDCLGSHWGVDFDAVADDLRKLAATPEQP